MIEKANICDHELLTQITQRSKAYWGYSNEQMEIWKDLLTITTTYLATKEAFKLTIGHEVIGYYSFYSENDDVIRLDNLFLLPEFIGKGFGKLLMNDFLQRVRNTNAKSVILDSEPFAEKFYAHFGFVKTGQLETLIKNRHLPIMELKLSVYTSL